MPVLARHKGDPIFGEKKQKSEAPKITPEKIELVMSQVAGEHSSATQEQAIAALIKHDGDIVEAIIELTI